MKNNILKKTNLILENRLELYNNKKKIILKIKKDEVKKTLLSKKVHYQFKFLKNKKNLMILKEKVQKIDPWYSKICKLKNLPDIIQKLAMNTSYKSGLKYWYVYLKKDKIYLIQNNEWTILKKELSKTTTKKIKLIIENPKMKHILTPYEWFDKIYREKISQEYISLENDLNIKILKKTFNIKFQKYNLNLI